MNTPLNFRLAAAAFCVVITFALLSGVAGMAKPQAPSLLLAQANSIVAIR
ncbi:MAG: hypothetical protein M3Y55_17640 [Pseudomonadota bacterium]|nr:hypothetical protein [Pseudomonadota bacterium]